MRALKGSYATLCKHLRSTYGERLTLNKMSATPYLDSTPLSETEIARMLDRAKLDHGLEFSKHDVPLAVRQIAAEREYHPVQRYLRGLTWDGEERIHRVTEEILHIDPTPLAQSTVREWFVSAVARPLRPGRRVDTMLVLCGSAGIRKSMFFKALGGEWFSNTSVVNVRTGRGRLQLASAWIYECSYFDAIIPHRSAPDLRAFVTTRYDTFKAPFQHGAHSHPRSTIIVGTTDRASCAKDPPDSGRVRKVWAKSMINIELLQKWRDQLWAEAMRALDAQESLDDG